MTQAPEQSAVPTEDTTQTRTQLVSLYVRGDLNDARALFSASPGASEAGWTSLERMLAPVRQFIQDGALPYVDPRWTGEYSGVGDVRSDLQEVVGESAPDGSNTSEAVAPADSSTPSSSGTSAAELIARAQQAQTSEELDEILALANGRVTVEDAVAVRQGELLLK